MKAYLSYCVLIALISITHGRERVDVQEEVNKITAKLEKFEKPDPKIIENFIEQIKASCRTNRTIEPEVMNNMTACAGKLFNQTALTTEIQVAIPKGDLDDVFRSVCLKWPKVKTCMKEGFDVMEECWAEGKRITKALDSMVEFFCEQDNSGARIALFFAEGGLTCLETHGDAVRNCVNEHFTEENQDLCSSVGQIHGCLTPLRKCKDVTPENLIGSMVRQVGKSLECPPISDLYTGNAKEHTSAAASHFVIASSSFFMGAIAFILAN